MTRHYKAPSADGALLAEPPTADYERLLGVNRQRLAGLKGEVAGLSWDSLRQLARREAVGQVSDRPLILAGHQPELYHPGVWVKNFILAGQSRRLGADALNLIVDNDTFKIRSLMLPVAAARPEQVGLETIPFDESVPEVPYEEAYPRDWPTLESWPQRVREVTSHWSFQPMLLEAWPRIVACLKTGAPYSRAFVEVRQLWERRWGGGTPELPVSQLALRSGFRHFARQLLGDAGNFATAYNTAIADYRQANGIRSRNHPAPELQIIGDLVESPFWTWRADSPVRQRVFVRRLADSIEVFAGPTLRLGTLPLAAIETESHRDLFEPFGWKLRPRALTLTLFSRLAVCDLFIHGIGGGKYDEVTDEIIRRYFRIEPPEYAVISATIRLPLERFATRPIDRTHHQRLMRDLEWNPQNFDQTEEITPGLAGKKRELIAAEPSIKADRRAWFRQLSDVTRQMRPATASQLEHAAVHMSNLTQELEANRKLARRDFSWVFYPEEYLAGVYRGFL